jgi:hypothetical protein
VNIFDDVTEDIDFNTVPFQSTLQKTEPQLSVFHIDAYRDKVSLKKSATIKETL